MSDIQFNVDDALAKLSEFARQYGSTALDYAGQQARVEAIGHLVLSIVAIVIAAAFFKLGLIQWRHNDDFDRPAAYAWWVPSVIATIFACVNLLDPWNWVTIFTPKLWLAHMLVLKVLG